MRSWPPLLLLMVLLTAPPAPAQQDAVPSVWVHLSPETRLREPGQERNAVQVDVSVGCALPSALAPGWRIEHEVEVRPEGAVTARLDRTSWSGTLPASSCTDQTAGAEYTLMVELRFNDRAVRPQVVEVVVWANVTLPGNPSYSTSWSETVGSAGDIEIIRYDTVRREGDAHRFEFGVVNRGLHPVVATSRISLEPERGTARLPTAMARVEDVRYFAVHYIPERGGADSFAVRVQVMDPGRVLAEETLVFDIEEPDRRDLAVAAEESGPAILTLFSLLLLATLALLFLKRQPKRHAEADPTPPLKNA